MRVPALSDNHQLRWASSVQLVMLSPPFCNLEHIARPMSDKLDIPAGLVGLASLNVSQRQPHQNGSHRLKCDRFRRLPLWLRLASTGHSGTLRHAHRWMDRLQGMGGRSCYRIDRNSVLNVRIRLVF